MRHIIKHNTNDIYAERIVNYYATNVCSVRYGSNLIIFKKAYKFIVIFGINLVFGVIKEIEQY